MKKIRIGLIAAAMASMFSGCDLINGVNGDNNNNGGGAPVQLTLIADSQASNFIPDSKTSITPEGNDVIWNLPENVSFYTDGVSLPADNVEQAKEGDKIKFTLSNVPGETSTIDGFFSGQYNEQAEIKDPETGRVKAFGITLPTLQKVTANSFDPRADALVMDTRPIVGQDLAKPVEVSYNRLFAITKVRFKGLEKYVDEKISRIEIFSYSQKLTGSCTYDYSAKRFLSQDGNYELREGRIFSVDETPAVLLEFAEPVQAGADFSVWMVTAPAEFGEGENLMIRFNTPTRTFNKEITLSKTSLKNDRLNNFVVNMNGSGGEDLEGQQVIMDLTHTSIPSGELQEGKNYFTAETKYLYDDPKSPNFAVIMGEGTCFNNKGTDSFHDLNPGQSFTLEGKKILSVEFSWLNVTNDISADAPGSFEFKPDGAVWTAAGKGTNRVTFTAGAHPSHFGITRLAISYDKTSKAIFTPEIIGISPAFELFEHADAPAQTVTVRMLNDFLDAGITVDPLVSFKATVNGKQITVQPSAVNNGKKEITEDLVIRAGSSTWKVTLMQKHPVSEDGGVNGGIDSFKPGQNW